VHLPHLPLHIPYWGLQHPMGGLRQTLGVLRFSFSILAKGSCDYSTGGVKLCPSQVEPSVILSSVSTIVGLL